jgi:hypothetical protein
MTEYFTDAPEGFARFFNIRIVYYKTFGDVFLWGAIFLHATQKLFGE